MELGLWVWFSCCPFYDIPIEVLILFLDGVGKGSLVAVLGGNGWNKD